MKRFYISSMRAESGIAKYSKDFFNLVLKNMGYEFVDSGDSLPTIMTRVRSIDKVHIEIGIFQTKETEILFAMLNAGYKRVSVTLHDAPLIKYPFRSFTNRFANNASKFFDIYIDRFSSLKPFVQLINSIYVLSRRGVKITKETFGTQNVYFLPHVVDDLEIKLSRATNSNFIYFGFIGKNKGVEYSLKIHREILKSHPQSQFYVVGKALGKENAFYEMLKNQFAVNVHYLGFVPDEQLDIIFDNASFAILPFRSYRFFLPVSGSILFNQKKGKVVFTTPVNAVPELILEGENGYYLSGILKDDIKKILSVLDNPDSINRVKQETFSRLLNNHTPEVVRKYILP